jgi:hypothetical protein
VRTQPDLGAPARLLGRSVEPRAHRTRLPAPLAAALALALALAAAPAGAAVPAAGPDSTLAFPSASVRGWQLGWARPDRLQHASLSFTLAAGATLASRRPLPSFAGVLALGLAKELWDARVTAFDPADLAAGAAGAALGASAARAGGN